MKNLTFLDIQGQVHALYKQTFHIQQHLNNIPRSSNDPNSYANTNQLQTNHIHLSLNVDFHQQILDGYVELQMLALESGKRIVLDSQFLNINHVLVSGESVNWTVKDETFGSPIVIPYSFKKDQEFTIKIKYQTTIQSTAVQWLTPQQTYSKTGTLDYSLIDPYLFTQCEAIHARTFLPCQDTPSVKCPYTAEITVPSRLRALMSALDNGTRNVSNGLTCYAFQQPVPIPAYLFALAVGNLKGIEIGPRTTVWSEPGMVEEGAEEFKETEKFLLGAEKVLSPYLWNRNFLIQIRL